MLEINCYKSKNEDLSNKMPTMGAPTILDKNETDEILDWIKSEQIN